MFGFIVNIFDVVLYRPLFNALVFLYDYLPGRDFGVAIIVLTLVIRFLLYPTSIKAVKSQKAVQQLQPKVQEIQKKYKDDKEKQSKEVLELYKKDTKGFINYFRKSDSHIQELIVSDLFNCEHINEEVVVFLEKEYPHLLREVSFKNESSAKPGGKDDSNIKK